MKLLGISTVAGNQTVEKVTQNALDVLQAAGLPHVGELAALLLDSITIIWCINPFYDVICSFTDKISLFCKLPFRQEQTVEFPNVLYD